MTLPLDLHPAEEFENWWGLWKTHRPKRCLEKDVARKIYGGIVNGGVDCTFMSDHKQYTVFRQATPQELYEGCDAYLWENRDVANTYIKHPQRFLKCGYWLDREQSIADMLAHRREQTAVKRSGSRNQLIIAVQGAESALRAATKYGTDADKAAKTTALHEAETALTEFIKNT